MTNGAGKETEWGILVDEGGTFTDVVAISDTGRVLTRKLPTDAAHIDTILSSWPGRVVELRRGTTHGTNALLERKGAPTVLITTAGFGDLPLIRDQSRPSLFSPAMLPPAPLYQEVLEVDERIDSRGQVLHPPPQALKVKLKALAQKGIHSAAIVLLNSYANPVHELMLARWCRQAGFSWVVTGHRVSPSRGFLARMETTLVDAAITPLLPRRQQGLWICSDGSLVPPNELRGAAAVLSGPAGGVVALEGVARAADVPAVIGLDMGGTSSDVSRWAGNLEHRHEHQVAGVKLRVPVLHVETVAAGGGSILSFQLTGPSVGPESAGANPGPACYGRGGPPTVTDANVVLGRIRPQDFPRICGPQRNLPLQPQESHKALTRLLDSAKDLEPGTSISANSPSSVQEMAERMLDLANAEMARGIERIASARGYDPADHALVVFGGAGPQHACELARRLNIGTVLIPGLAALLSAYGLGLAERRTSRLMPLHVALEDWDEVERAWALLSSQAPSWARTEKRTLHVRYRGTGEPLEVSGNSPQEVRRQLSMAHQSMYGFDRSGEALEVVNARVEWSKPGKFASMPLPGASMGKPMDRHKLWCRGWLQARVWKLGSLGKGQRIESPALVVDQHHTVFVPPGWQATMLETGVLKLEHSNHGQPEAMASSAPPGQTRARIQLVPPRIDPFLVSLAGNRLAGVAERMGETLRRLARSTNVRERRDYSCAIFDQQGHLLANAAHIPVHLGAMGATVRALLPQMRANPGISAWISNDPYNGGSHLPDITVVSPLRPTGDRQIWFLANRAHHLDVGGLTPGSMPPHSTSIADEGALLEGQPLTDQRGRILDANIRALLSASRELDTVIGDLDAQVAANEIGKVLLTRWLQNVGHSTATVLVEELKHRAERALLAAVPPPGVVLRAQEILDDGSVIKVRLQRTGPTTNGGAGRLLIDFSGTSMAGKGNLNAPLAVTTAAVLYTFRCVSDREVPLNEGALRALEIKIPHGSMLDPHPPAPVCGGNVEISQRLVDLLLRALHAQASGQGTMNNLSLGLSEEDNHRTETCETARGYTWAYYETIAGGGGAGPGFHGSTGLQVHMTNTRITDVEVLEAQIPIRVERFSIRLGSGGEGRWRGGNGLVRELRFLAPVRVSLLVGRRDTGAPGAAGGLAGAPGRDLVDRGHGWEPAPTHWMARAGDLLRIETPGGGGWGAA